MATLMLRSDVSNDLRQSADQIGSISKALTEFVWNSVQYQPDGQTAVVDVTIRRTRNGTLGEVVVVDNGRGMSHSDLQNFFVMHAENRDRLAGRFGRGRFGTGAKAAAMAVANEMIVDTVKDGKRTVATLRRDMLRPGSSQIPIPSEISLTDQPNGTRVRLRQFRIRRPKEEAAKLHLRRALGRLLLSHRVSWNGDPLEYNEPAYRTEWIFDPPEEYIPQIGHVQLHLRLAERWLSDEDRGVTFTAREVTHECNFLGNHATSPSANKLFGHVEVPLLEIEDDEGRPAYTADRAMTLKRENLRVAALISWVNDVIGDKIKALDAEERAQQDRARQERLSQTAKTIEEALNRRLTSVFENLERKINLKVAANPSPTGVDVREAESSSGVEVSAGTDGEREFFEDENGKIRWREAIEGETPDLPVHRRGKGSGNGGGELAPKAVKDPDGDKAAKSRDTNRGKRQRLEPKGTFRVVPKAMGPSAPRAYYASTYLTIYVNTDHPQILAAGDESSPEFKILLAECAASEFALALTEMRIEHGDPEIDPSQWQTIVTAIRNEESETGAALAQAIASYRAGG